MAKTALIIVAPYAELTGRLPFKLVGKSGKGSFWFSNNGDQSGYEGKSSSDHVISEGRVECSGH